MNQMLPYNNNAQPPQKSFDFKKGVFVALLAGGLIYMGKKALDTYQQRGEENKTADDVNTQQALLMIDAVKWWGGDKRVIMNLAKQGFDFEKVSVSYTKLTGGKHMIDDIRSKLSTDELTEFMNIIKDKSAQNKQAVKAGKQTAAETVLPSTASYRDNTIAAKIVLCVNDTQVWNPLRKNWLTGAYKELKSFKKGTIIQGATTGQVSTIDKRYELYVCAVTIGTTVYQFLADKKDVSLITVAESTAYIKKYGYKVYSRWDDAKVFDKGWKI